MNGLAIDGDALGNQLQMRTGGAAGATTKSSHQRLNHAHSGSLAIRAGNVNDWSGTLGMAKDVHQHLDPLERWVNLGLRPALIQLGFHLCELAQLLCGGLQRSRLVDWAVHIDRQAQAFLGHGDLTEAHVIGHAVIGHHTGDFARLKVLDDLGVSRIEFELRRCGGLFSHRRLFLRHRIVLAAKIQTNLPCNLIV